MLVERAGLFYDAGNYTTIAASGYASHLVGLSAFYPLWPIVLRAATFWTDDRIVMGWVGSFVAAGLFGLTLILISRWAQELRLSLFKGFVFAALVLCPLSLFRVLPFTESLFSLLLVLLVSDLCRDVVPLWRFALYSLLLSALRPMFPFLIVASALIFVLVQVANRSTADDKRQALHRMLAIAGSAPIGYLPYGLWCQHIYGNFWQPFDAQSQWGRQFGFYWQLILSPKVINGSNEVLVWDLIGFYAPLVLFLVGIYLFLVKRIEGHTRLVTAYWMMCLIGLAHSAASFLTYERFMSIGRHVLANPLPFMAVLIVLQYTPERRRVMTESVLKFLVFASVIFLGMWWFRFAKDQWIG